VSFVPRRERRTGRAGEAEETNRALSIKCVGPLDLAPPCPVAGALPLREVDASK
jgi:hypothetical protein